MRDTPVEAEFVNLQVSTLHDTQQFDMAGVMVRPSLNIGLDNLAAPEHLNKWTSPERPQRAQVGRQRSSSAHRTKHPGSKVSGSHP